MDKMQIYNKAKEVPEEAKKPIEGGKLKGFSNINPMYRFKRLTEIFGPVGTGWWYEITNKQLHPLSSGEIFCFVDINMYYKTEDGEVSKPIPGTGGSSFVANTKSGLQASDECFKMALTDAISVSAKALGIGADVYWSEDHETKYEQFAETVQPYIQPTQPQQAVQPAPAYQPTQQPMPQAQYQQPMQAQPMQMAQPAPQAYTGAQPTPQAQQPVQQMTVEQAKAVVCTVGYQSGKTLGEIMSHPRAKESFDFLIRQAPTPEQRAAAQLLKEVLKKDTLM